MLKPHAKDPNQKSELKRFKNSLKDPRDHSFGLKEIPRPADWKEKKSLTDAMGDDQVHDRKLRVLMIEHGITKDQATLVHNYMGSEGVTDFGTALAEMRSKSYVRF